MIVIQILVINISHLIDIYIILKSVIDVNKLVQIEYTEIRWY